MQIITYVIFKQKSNFDNAVTEIQAKYSKKQ